MQSDNPQPLTLMHNRHAQQTVHAELAPHSRKERARPLLQFLLDVMRHQDSVEMARLFPCNTLGLLKCLAFLDGEAARANRLDARSAVLAGDLERLQPRV